MQATRTFFEFIWLRTFQSSAAGLLGESERKAIEDALLADPRVGPVIPNTGGVRKMRLALPGRGKSGGARVIYYYGAAKGRIYLIAAYAKNVKADLSEADKAAIRRLVEVLDAER
ncbi:MAG TPA: type II toxin-antitoxin system RelE/ParE family toxin [Longimicrobiales bacterium]|nr:type II toxin-antitoxin system RelE/ParE family toxin [Longimicrobiales bacterium]